MRIKQSLLSLLRSPHFSVPAVLMLAGGLAFSTTCFAVLEAAVFHSIPYKDPSHLVQIVKTKRESGTGSVNLSRADFLLLSKRSHTFERLGYEVDAQGLLTEHSGHNIPITEAKISNDLLAVFGVPVAKGRSFRRSDWKPSAPPVIILSFELWTSAFQADPDILGKHVTVDGQDLTVVGIFPDTLRHPVSVADVWVPDTSSEVGPESESISDKYVVARLKQQDSMADAQRGLFSLQPIVLSQSEHTNFDADSFQLLSLSDQLVGPTKRILELLLSACLSIQVIASLNVGSLLLARRISKARDLGVRIALGAKTARLFFDMLSETMLIAMSATFTSLLLLFLILPAAAALASTVTGRPIHPHLSVSILAFCVLTGLFSCLVCSTVPVVLLRRLDVTALINEQWKAGPLSIRASRIQDVLTVLQISAAVILMLQCGLLVKSVYLLSTERLGFDPRHLSYFTLDGAANNFPKTAFTLHEGLSQLSRIRSIQSVAIGSTPLLSGAMMTLRIAAQAKEGAWLTLPPVEFQTVSGGYFSTLGIPLLSGRTFDDHDVKGNVCVAVVNRTFGRLVWSINNPIGNLIDSNGGYGGKRVPCEIVGVVGDSRDIALARPYEPQIFFSDLQQPGSGVQCVYVKTANGSAVSADTIRRILLGIDPTRNVVYSNDIEALLDSALSPSTTRMKLLATLAFAALLLAAGGMYAAAMYGLSARTREIGIRLAMGASRANIASLIVFRYFRLGITGVLTGVLAGGALSDFFGRGLALVDLKGYDPFVFITVPMICMVTMLVSVIAPTLRATRLNPSVLLRDHAS